MLVCGKIDFQLKHCTAKGGRHQLNLKTINYKSYSTNNVFRDWLPASFVKTSNTTECWGMFFFVFATITDHFDTIFSTSNYRLPIQKKGANIIKGGDLHKHPRQGGALMSSNLKWRDFQMWVGNARDSRPPLLAAGMFARKVAVAWKLELVAIGRCP